MQADQIFMSLYNDYMRSEAHQVENLLNKGVAVLVYTGQDNLKVHAPGTMKWVDRLYFNDAENFQKGILNTWKVNNKIAGTVKSAGNLELRIVFNAGRYVAADQP
jgi:carboxypeptidase C (cathepsin A)